MSSEATSPQRQLEPTNSLRLRERLRAETRQAHEALDTQFADMLRPDAQGLYARFLLTNRAGHAATEPFLLASPLSQGSQNAWEPHGRLQALEADCAALALPAWQAPGFSVADATLSEALGVAYVLEGSRLGAGFLLKALRRQDAPSSLPVRYLEASSDPEPFRRLIARMSALAPSGEEADRTVAAANRTFRYFSALAEGARIRMTIS